MACEPHPRAHATMHSCRCKLLSLPAPNIPHPFGTRRAHPVRRRTPIPAEAFQPPQTSCPRPWQRVAVAPVPGLRRQPKIWKRVGGLPTEPSQGPYERAMAELEEQAREARKRTRHARHVAAFGNAIWDPRAEEEHDGRRDLEEARGTGFVNNHCVMRSDQETPATVLAAKNDAEADAASSSNNARTRPSTFPEASLKWVPRKRHNSRWPIGPERGVAVPPHGEVPLKMDEKEMMRRSTRRLGRRLSLFPGEDSPRKLPMIALAPVKGLAPVFSPVKRPLVALSPAKVADSPLRSFRITATPTKVVLESPKTSPPVKSPAKPASSPIAPVENTASTPANKTAAPRSPAHLPASPVPLLFDQPSPGGQAKPQHEVRRRLSLQSARRSERGSSGVSRLLALKSGRNSPNRRHSFTSIDNLAAEVRGESKSRRNTMDTLCVSPDEVRRVSDGDEDLGGSAAHGTEEVVEVDMKTSLDIFGQPNKAVEPAGSRRNSDESVENSESAVCLANRGSVPQDVILSSSPTDGFVVSGVEGEASPHQASTSSDAPQSDPEEHDSLPEPAPLYFEDLPDFVVDLEQSETTYAPHDPEGLSTIFEESSVMESPCAEGVLVEQQFAQESVPGSTSSSDGELTPLGLHQDACSTADAVAHDAKVAGLAFDVTQVAVDGQLRSESLPGTPPFVNMSTCHVAGAANAMSPSDSPHLDREPPAPQPTFEMQADDKSPSSGSEDAVATPPASDNFVGSETEARHATPSRQPGNMRVEDSAQDNALPGTPPAATAADLAEPVVTPESNAGALAAQESSGFTPINGRRASPPHVPSSPVKNADETEAGHESDDLDADEVVEMEFADEGCEPTVAMDDDNPTVEAPRPQNDTLQLHGRHDDSETEMLRNFVTRVTADKNAKAAAAAAALAKKSARRSGSIGLTTSSTGSPMAKGPETPASRKPLGAKSPNSTSPAKKRKHELVEDGGLAKDSHEPSSHPRDDGPRLKRRRKRTDPTPDDDPTTTITSSRAQTPSPEPDSHGDNGPRRSTRARSTRVPLRPSALSANAIAFSMIPVRLPGMGAMDDAAMDAHIAGLARQRSDEKDLAAVTRGNTRKNKAGAVPPQVLLARQAEDPTAWRMRELKGVYEARERRAAAAAAAREDGERGGKGKGVRWDEELVRFQECEPSVFRGLARGLLADVVMMDGGDDDGVDEIAEAEPPAAAEPVVEKTARVAARKAAAAAPPVPPPASAASTRRTRSSRLTPPTPVAKIAEKAAAPSAAPAGLRTRARSLPRLAPAPSAPAPVLDPTAVSTPAVKTASARTGMATRRTRIAKLGMSGNGTPAPKRRGRV